MGVKMSALKARIVDMVLQGGQDGVEVNEVFKTVFRERGCSPHTLKAHVWQINQLLADGGHRIIAFREHNQHHVFDRYRMIRLPPARKSA